MKAIQTFCNLITTFLLGHNDQLHINCLFNNTLTFQQEAYVFGNFRQQGGISWIFDVWMSKIWAETKWIRPAGQSRINVQNIIIILSTIKWINYIYSKM